VGREFIYPAVTPGSWSRRRVGRGPEPYLEAELAIEALGMALATRNIEPGLVHHSGRGVQYASSDYVGLLDDHGVKISMSRRGNCYDNAKAESFVKTLKYEEVYLSDYESIGEARESIGKFNGDVYNRKRLHSAPG
jgi:putative transposase